jgi:hypothetical protein
VAFAISRRESSLKTSRRQPALFRNLDSDRDACDQRSENVALERLAQIGQAHQDQRQPGFAIAAEIAKDVKVLKHLRIEHVRLVEGDNDVEPMLASQFLRR